MRMLQGLKNRAMSRFMLGTTETNGEIAQLYSRSKNIAKVCSALKERESTKDLTYAYSRIYKSDDYKLAYCGIQKIGSSFLKRVFKVLNQDNQSEVHLFDMPSMDAHRSIPRSMLLSKKEAPEVLSEYTTFMFIRDPFARLFSCYVDKFMSPNSNALKILKDSTSWYKFPENWLNKNCGLYIPFSDLCAYVAYAVLHNKTLDGHLSPMHEHCEPCYVNYTLIGKMESFMTDTQNILKIAGIDQERVMGKVDDVDASNEMSLIKELTNIDYKFQKILSHCTTLPETLQRLWRVFQIRGFISKTIDFPQHFLKIKDGAIPEKDFMQMALSAYENSGDRSLRRRQKDEAMQEAYAQVDPEILQNLALALEKDCTLFEYSCDINERFLNAGEVKPFYFKFWSTQ